MRVTAENMSDRHAHHHGSENIRTAFFLNVGFTILELFGGIWTNSVAILSDAIHDLGDSASLGIAWYLDAFSNRQRDAKYSYGYRRFSLLGALISTLILIAGSVVVLTKALPRLVHPEATRAPEMVAFAVVGVAVNTLAALRLRHNQSLNARVVALHLIEDVLGWASVLIVSVVLLFRPFYVLDAVLSILIAAYILWRVIGNLRKILGLFLQSIPDQVDIGEIEKRILEIGKICSCHHTHCWSLDGEHHVLTTHIVLDEDVSRDEVLNIKNRIQSLAKAMNFTHITVETEFAQTDCTMNYGMRENAHEHTHDDL